MILRNTSVGALQDNDIQDMTMVGRTNWNSTGSCINNLEALLRNIPLAWRTATQTG